MSDVIARLREARAAAGGDEWVAMPRLGANRVEMEAYWTRLIEAGNTLVAVDVTTNRRNQPGVDEASTRFIVLAANHIDALLDVCEAARAYLDEPAHDLGALVAAVRRLEVDE